MNLLKALFSRGKKQPDPACAVILVAAGNAARMEGLDKVVTPIKNIPVIIHSLQPFEDSPLVREIIVVTRRDLLVEVGQLCRDHDITKVKSLIPGGETRVHSVMAGLRQVSPSLELVAVHDGARPFVTAEVVEEVIRAAARTGAAAPAIPVKDTVKVVKDGVVQRTLKRESLRAVQTPQVFETSLLKGALAKALADEAPITDDCSAVERLGFPVTITAGSEENIKITTPADLTLGEAIVAGRDGW